MMRQYRQIKQQHPGVLLFFRLGDFYEMFFEDAELAARELEITLTGRDAGKELGRVPMCGVPYHAAQGYIQRLIEKGYRVAICEQVEDPRAAKGVVRREVVRIITPGTVTDPLMLDEKLNTYVAALAALGGDGPRSPLALGLACADASTGEFMVTEFSGAGALQAAREELFRLRPAELVVPAGPGGEAAPDVWQEALPAAGGGWRPAVSPQGQVRGPVDAYQRLVRHFQVQHLRGFGLEELRAATWAAGLLLDYLRETQCADLNQVNRVHVYFPSQFMALDPATRRHLELTERMMPGTAGRFGRGAQEGTLLGALDRTVTSPGARLLRRWIEAPLIDAAAIEARLDAVQALLDRPLLRSELRAQLRGIYDLERLSGRIAAGHGNARDLVALRQSLERLPAIQAALTEEAATQGAGSAAAAQPGQIAALGLLAELAGQIQPLPQLAERIAQAIADDPPATLTEGGLIRPGYHPEVDELRAAQRDGKSWIAQLEERERQRLGIKSLKIGYNKIFGYYLEVTRANLAAVPDDYIRKQTLANAERFVTPALKEMENRLLGAEERLAALEHELFSQVRAEAAAHTVALQQTAQAVAALDVLAGLAEVAAEQGYVRPQIDSGDVIEITGGRHPVVEQIIGAHAFVPNDTRLDAGKRRLVVITGPNMGGKSTYLRQTALIALMAQIGSLVPAERARIGVVDRIFTRVGAADDLAGGQSTFMVEMAETAYILHAATPRSLVLLDEVGRGTSTFDGLSLAWAIAEHLATQVRARTLFATHYHELTDLARDLDGVANASVAVQEQGEEIVFLRRVVEGPCDRSYGIHVARLAGLPRPVLDRARELLWRLEQLQGTLHREAAGGQAKQTSGAELAGSLARQVTLFPSSGDLSEAEREVLDRLRKFDLMQATPLQAIQLLFELQSKLRSGA